MAPVTPQQKAYSSMNDLRALFGEHLPTYIYSLAPDWDGHLVVTVKGNPKLNLPKEINGVPILIRCVPEDTEIIAC